MNTPKTTATTPALWCGWARQGRERVWKLLVRGALSEGEALNRLRTLTGHAKFVDLLVRRADAAGLPRPAV
jgi:hypothetical protein